MDPGIQRESARMRVPVPEVVPPGQVRQQAREHSEKIFMYWDMLRKILDRHEDRLRKRWTKKSREQRRTVLLEAWPNMPRSHRPDYQAFRAIQYREKRDVYLFPYINLEDLIQPKSLLIFLNSRGRHHPQMFSHADLEASHLGKVSCAIDRVYVDEHTMYLTGTTPKSYGRLIFWDDDPDAFEMLRTQREFYPGDGLNTLESQERILQFLVGCCKAILQMNEATLLGDMSPIQPEPPAVSADSKEFPTIAAMAQEAPYRLPAELDLNNLKSFISAKRSEVEDHLWSLREDPGHFEETAVGYFEHRQENLPDTNGEPHPSMGESGKRKLWN